jgi:hypothetical protein
MTEYKKYMEEAAKRDHRKIGREQELFVFHDLSPGSAFFLPLGMRIYNTLLEFMKVSQLAVALGSSWYAERIPKTRLPWGYVPLPSLQDGTNNSVGSPNIYNSKLWQTSGHWQNYAEDMFQLKVDEEQFAVKPMNCPGHALIFDARERSYKELPLRLAEFGVLHRNEASGALSGLTRVRRFVQDDGMSTDPSYEAKADQQPISSVRSTRSNPRFKPLSSSLMQSTNLSDSTTKSVYPPGIPASGWVIWKSGIKPRVLFGLFWKRGCLGSGRRIPRMLLSMVQRWAASLIPVFEADD